MLLEGYCKLNYEAIQKILKKHDKNSGKTKKNKFMSDVVHKLDFYSHNQLKLLTSETEVCF